MTANGIDLRFYEDGHRYTLNGADAPSVTTILSSEGLNGSDWWTEAARKRGSAVHKIALLISKREISGATIDEVIGNSLWDPEATAPALVPYGRALAAYLLDSGFRPELVETPAGSINMGITGTPDAYGRLPDGKTLLIDYKSGEVLPAAYVQLALYAALLEECYGLRPDLRTVVQLRADGKYKAYPPRRCGSSEDLAIGICAVNLYHWRRKHRML